jgi:hypothetical protein
MLRYARFSPLSLPRVVALSRRSRGWLRFGALLLQTGFLDVNLTPDQPTNAAEF